MNQLRVIIFVFIFLLLILSITPYPQESFNDIDLDKYSCMDLLRSRNDTHALIGSIESNPNRQQSINDLQRSIIVRHTAAGPVYTYDENNCVIETEKFPLYGMNNACSLSNLKLIPTNDEDAIQGCKINTTGNTFPQLLDTMYDTKNNGILTQISNYNSSANTFRSQNDILSSSIITKHNESVTASNAFRFAESNVLGYTQLYNDMKNKYDTLKKSLTVSIGNCADNAAISAAQIREIGGPSIDGIYYILCGGVPREVFCLMNPRFDGGGWMLLMKMAPGNTFQFSSQHWTNATTLNASSTNMNREDAKFEVFNTVPVKDVLALFSASDIGKTGGSMAIKDYWVWQCNNWYRNGQRTTALNGFNEARDATPASPRDFSGWDNEIFSSQAPSMRHVFGGHSHLGVGWSGFPNDWGTVRWGFVFNENGANDFSSCDAWSGIGGGSRRFEQGTHTFSAGDYYGCCGRKGRHTRFTCYLFGR